MKEPPDQPPFDIGWRRADPDELAWEEKSVQLELKALDNVRVAAEKWAASLAAILGLFGTIVLVKGREDISTLAVEYQAAVAASLLMGFLAAAVAVYETALAAQGTPGTVSWPSGGELREWEYDEALAAKGKLRRSRLLTGVAVLLVLLAVGLTWFGKQATKNVKGQVVVVTSSGVAPRCGTLVAGRGGSGALALRPERSKSIALSAGTTITLVTSCPKR